MTAMGKTKTHFVDPSHLGFWRDGSAPATPLQALMECAPFDEPEESVLERELKVEPLRDAMDAVLDDRERWVLESIFYRRRGIRLLAGELNLSKTHIARIRDVAFRKIHDHMNEEGTAP